MHHLRNILDRDHLPSSTGKISGNATAPTCCAQRELIPRDAPCEIVHQILSRAVSARRCALFGVETVAFDTCGIRRRRKSMPACMSS